MIRICLSILFVSVTILALAQHGPGDNTGASDDPSILTPSPTASELGKYGLIPMGLSTGSANVSIPVHTFEAGKISVPISLNYNSNGFKVDQVASWVGLNWSLNAGGAITRIVRDLPDDDVQYDAPFPSSDDQHDPEFATYLVNAGEPTFDSEQDLYTFNFLGYNGKFVFDRTGSLVIMPFQNIKIERVITDVDNNYFVITTPDGIVFTFGYPEFSRTTSLPSSCGRSYDFSATAWYLTKINHPAGDSLTFNYTGHGYTYTTGVSQSMTTVLEEKGTCDNNGTIELSRCPTINDKLCTSVTTIRGGYLSSITSSKYGSIIFNATHERSDVGDVRLNGIDVLNADETLTKTFGLNYTFTTSTDFSNTLTTEDLKHRMFLSSFDEKDVARLTVRSHDFSYNDITALPPRLSYAQDLLGNFNGAHNNYLVPLDPMYAGLFVDNSYQDKGGDRNPNADYAAKGLLSKVRYPTGGESTIYYEANTYWGKKLVQPSHTAKLNIAVRQDSIERPTQRDTASCKFINVVNQTIEVIFSASSTANGSADPLHDMGSFSVSEDGKTIGSATIKMSAGSNGNSTPASIPPKRFFLTAGKTYVFTAVALGLVSATITSNDYYDKPPYVTTTNLPTFGVRVSKVVNYDPITDRNESTNYTYAEHTASSKSSGVKGSDPVYFRSYYDGNMCGETLNPCRYGALSSNSLLTLYPTGGNNIYYEYVMVSKGDSFENGLEEHQFLIQFDVRGKVVCGDDIFSAGLTNFSWGNGEELANRIYKQDANDFTIVKETINNYVSDDRNRREVANLTVQKRYNLVISSAPVRTYTCSAEDVKKVYQVYLCVTSHSHSFWIGNWPWKHDVINGYCKAKGHNNQWVIYGQHPCYGQAPNSTITVVAEINNIDAVEYKNIAFWHYLQSTTETIYDQQGASPHTVVKEYKYDNPNHGFLTSEKVSTSSLKTEERKYYYLQDYGQIENFQTLDSKWIYNVPLKKEVYLDGLLTQGTVVKLDDFGQTKEQYVFETATPQVAIPHSPTLLIPSVDYKSKATFNYDTQSSNLIEYKSTKAPKVVYLWGYDNTHPIAEVKNAELADVAYTSFEPTSNKGWTFSGAPQTDASSVTGSKLYVVENGNITTTALTPSKTYILSYYCKNSASIAITGGVSSNEIITPVNSDWNLVVKRITNTTSITISGSGAIDELRLYPAGALMTTFTYNTDRTLRSVTDVNGVTQIYYYDTFGRLEKIIDNNGKLINSYEYHYYKK